MNEKQALTIALIEGDGIGPEIIKSARDVLAAAAGKTGLRLSFGVEQGGAQTYKETGQAMSAETLERLRSDYDAILKGPVGLPHVRAGDGTEAGLLGGIMRTGLDAFANVRPIQLLAGIQAVTRHPAGAIDYVIVRENTEGLYISRGGGVRTADAACDQMLITSRGTERVARFAFDLARSRSGAPGDGVRRVTCVDKSNVLRSLAFFRECVERVAAEYPDVELAFAYADAAAHSLVTEPELFDVVVAENFIGDILSDVGAATVGGLGMCPSGNIGADAAYFEPIHGSAPTLAGKDRANPTSQVLAAAMLLDHLGARNVGDRVRNAVTECYESGSIVLDGSGCPVGGTRAATRSIVDHL